MDHEELRQAIKEHLTVKLRDQWRMNGERVIHVQLLWDDAVFSADSQVFPPQPKP